MLGPIQPSSPTTKELHDIGIVLNLINHFRLAKRAKENEVKDLKLKYDVLKRKYESEAYGKKSPKKARDENETLKQENENLVVKIASLEQVKASLDDQLKLMSTRESDLKITLEKVQKRSKARFVRIRRQIKANGEIKTKFEETKRQFSALEKAKSELDSVNSAIELELKSEQDFNRSIVEKFTAEKDDMIAR